MPGHGLLPYAGFGSFAGGGLTHFGGGAVRALWRDEKEREMEPVSNGNGRRSHPQKILARVGGVWYDGGKK